MEFVSIRGEMVEVSKKEAEIYRKVKTYKKNYTRCKNLAELKAFRLLNGYQPGWLWHKQNELKFWR